MALIASTLLPLVVGLLGQSAAPHTPATLVEAHEFEACDSNCMVSNRPTTAYCVRIEDRFEVGERSGHFWLGEDDRKSLRSEVGKSVDYEGHGHTFQLSAQARTVTVTRGTKFEDFQDPSCRAEVHKANLEEARGGKRPQSVPISAVAISGSFVGDYRPHFVWHQCTQGVDTIDCAKWYPDGTSRGVDHYCRLAADLDTSRKLLLDQVASVEGKLILASGVPLQLDHRGRANNVLQNPSQTCH